MPPGQSFTHGQVIGQRLSAVAFSVQISSPDFTTLASATIRIELECEDDVAEGVATLREQIVESTQARVTTRGKLALAAA